MTPPAELKPEFVALLACPKCRLPVAQDGGSIRCRNPDCALSYPIRDGIPVMLIEEAVAPARTCDGLRTPGRAAAGD